MQHTKLFCFTIQITHHSYEKALWYRLFCAHTTESKLFVCSYEHPPLNKNSTLLRSRSTTYKSPNVPLELHSEGVSHSPISNRRPMPLVCHRRF